MPRQPESWLAARGCLDLIWAGWPGCPLSSAQRVALDHIADHMPAIPRLGLELRLGGDGAMPDLHQLVLSEPTERAVLLDYLDALPVAGDEDGAAFHAFLRRWADDDAFAAAFPQLYLEYDVPPEQDAASVRLVPSAFLDVHRRTGDAADRSRREAMALEAIRRARASDPSARACLEKAFAAAAGPGSIGHFGLMFARSGAAVRLNVRDLQRGALPPFLRAIGWPGDVAAADNLFEWLIDETDRVTIALDLADAWLPRIGFETFIDAPPGQDLRHRRLFDWLCAEGLCTPDLTDALVAYPGISRPGVQGAHWPASWVVATMLAPRDHLPLLRRDLSHVKFTIDGDGTRHAKAYLGAVHDWRTAAADTAEAVTFPARPIAAAITAATGFLVSRAKQGGYWRDFHLDIGFSDEWVTAFVGVNLARSGEAGAHHAAMRALDWLERRQRLNGGWGYNATSPGDADSTAWALHLAAALGGKDAMAVAGQAFLAAHLLPGGGVATYAPTTPIRFRDVLLEEESAAGWRAAHDCVAANAAALLGEEAMTHLRDAQRPDGAWHAHWWTRDVFATALAVEALALTGEAGDTAAIDRAIRWAEDQMADASAFDLACFVSMARHRVTAEALAPWISRLLAQQYEDGGWPGGAAMLFPLPWQTERSEETTVHHDLHGCFTTAMALGALSGVTRQQRITT